MGIRIAPEVFVAWDRAVVLVGGATLLGTRTAPVEAKFVFCNVKKHRVNERCGRGLFACQGSYESIAQVVASGLTGAYEVPAVTGLIMPDFGGDRFSLLVVALIGLYIS
jgi:hypothetical protein